MLDIWHIDLDIFRPILLVRCELMDAAEQDRSRRFIREVDADDFRASHVALRLVLSRYGPAKGPFERSPEGKPRLAQAPHFSYARTSGAAVVAVSTAAVGVDIERMRPIRLHEPAVLQLADLAAVTPLEAWTYLEAWAKRDGCGVGQLLVILSAPGAMAGWWHREQSTIQPVVLAPGLVAAVSSEKFGVTSIRSMGAAALNAQQFPD